MKTLRDAIVLILIGAAMGLAVNGVRTGIAKNGLSLRTPWPDNRVIRELEVPPSYEVGDSLLSLEDAYSIYLDSKAVFIDAREPEEYRSGHIKNAINFPFEQWDDYWESVKPALDPDLEIVAYCGGLDCELSLFMARELKQLGYKKSYIFFGGWNKWQSAGLPVIIGENN